METYEKDFKNIEKCKKIQCLIVERYAVGRVNSILDISKERISKREDRAEKQDIK